MSLSLMFFQRCYTTDSEFDNIVYKILLMIINIGGLMSRIVFVKRIEDFLESLNLIEEVDLLLKQKTIDVNYEESRIFSKTGLWITMCAVFPLYISYFNPYVAEYARFYNFMVLCFANGISIGTVLMEIYYLVCNAMLLRKRFRILASHVGKYFDIIMELVQRVKCYIIKGFSS